ncbi:MAG TPA: alpha/beta hydrolase [Ramlibacter sp.]|jgi:pimeloyl-ACP methyl ester carboxylesterase|uniref:alpha/beta fold hydrolase n=1 Tax=Ramlibacter sp. TaxID=1917967 RepID=UPI002D2A1C02|nr:alpha/beta hydrolase [Ramlibacter sp.]HZY18902.1 alpha/beta hydrolase [Ramlibacter sp.]
MIQTWLQPLAHGITLSCRAAGERGRPVLLFLHGFPEAAFVWDELLLHFARPENGGYRCVAPNLRGFERSSTPADVAAYRPKHLVQDIAALIALEGGTLDCLVAHDWGGAVAWNLANQLPHLARRLAIINSPHPGTFLRELRDNPRQQEASAYMNFLIRPDAEQLLAQDDYRRLWAFFTGWGDAGWLTEPVKAQYRQVWNGPAGSPPGSGLVGGCNYYRTSPLRPPRPGDPAAAGVTLPPSMLSVPLPTLVLWGMEDTALPPGLVEGLEDYVPQLTLERVPGASHWIVHERPGFVADRLAAFLASPA